MVVLATAIEPPENAGADRLHIWDGPHPRWLVRRSPSQTATGGDRHSRGLPGWMRPRPRDVPDTVAHAGAAASEVVTLFNQGEVTISPTIAEVNPENVWGVVSAF